MPLNTFAPSIKPSPGGSSSPEINLRTAEFGDGYTQSAPSGLNYIREMIDLRWDGITYAQRQELDAFFKGQGGYIPFLYQPYGFDVVLRWTCKEWSSSTKVPFTYSAALVQDFSLDV